MITIDEKFEINLLSPVDLIISKLTRFAQNDEEDIANIIKTGKVDKDELPCSHVARGNAHHCSIQMKKNPHLHMYSDTQRR